MRVSIGILVVLAAACGRIAFDHRHDAGASSPDDATTGDAAGDGPLVDAASACIAATCTAAGGQCDMGTCVIDLVGNATCPADQPCVLRCTEIMPCNSFQMRCPPGGTCKFLCSGDMACNSVNMDCDGAFCDVYCDGNAACNSSSANCNAGACTQYCCNPTACNSFTLGGTGTWTQATACP